MPSEKPKKEILIFAMGSGGDVEYLKALKNFEDKNNEHRIIVACAKTDKDFIQGLGFETVTMLGFGQSKTMFQQYNLHPDKRIDAFMLIAAQNIIAKIAAGKLKFENLVKIQTGISASIAADTVSEFLKQQESEHAFEMVHFNDAPFCVLDPNRYPAFAPPNSWARTITNWTPTFLAEPVMRKLAEGSYSTTFNPYRQDIGLSPVNSFGMIKNSDKHFLLFPKAFFPNRKLPPGIKGEIVECGVLQSSITKEEAEQRQKEIPEALNKFISEIKSGEKISVITGVTAARVAKGTKMMNCFETIVEACKDRKTILVTHVKEGDKTIEDLQKENKNLIHLDYVPFDLLLHALKEKGAQTDFIQPGTAGGATMQAIVEQSEKVELIPFGDRLDQNVVGDLVERENIGIRLVPGFTVDAVKQVLDRASEGREIRAKNREAMMKDVLCGDAAAKKFLEAVLAEPEAESKVAVPSL